MARDVRDEQIGNTEFILCCLVFATSLALTLITVFAPTLLYSYESGLMRTMDLVVVLAAELGALALAYHANARGDGKRFWYRYISVGTPIFLILMLAAFAFGVVAGIVEFVTGTLIIGETFGIKDLILQIAFSVVFLFFIHKYMGLAARGSSASINT
jgi:hypothetical protein